MPATALVVQLVKPEALVALAACYGAECIRGAVANAQALELVKDGQHQARLGRLASQVGRSAEDRSERERDQLARIMRQRSTGRLGSET